MSNVREETIKLAHDYKQVIRDFLGGGVDELFSFVQNNPKIITHPFISMTAKEMLHRALRQQQADAEAYHAVVRLAKEAGVPLIAPTDIEKARGLV